MFSGERSKTATGGDGDDIVPCETELYDTVLCAGGGDFAMKPFVRAQAAVAEGAVTATVSSSDSVKSITLSLPFIVHAVAAAAAEAAAGVVVAAAAATGCTFCGVSTTETKQTTRATLGT